MQMPSSSGAKSEQISMPAQRNSTANTLAQTQRRHIANVPKTTHTEKETVGSRNIADD